MNGAAESPAIQSRSDAVRMLIAMGLSAALCGAQDFYGGSRCQRIRS